MFAHLGEEGRHAVLSIYILNFPLDEGLNLVPFGEQNDSTKSWQEDFLSTLAVEINVDTGDCLSQLRQINEKYKESFEHRDSIAKSSSAALRSKIGIDDLRLLAYFLTETVDLKKYDSRGSTMIRSICHSLNLPSSELVWLISQFGLFLAMQYDRIAHQKEVKHDRFRYAKIGAAAVGAGALIFFTAGLVRLYLFYCTGFVFVIVSNVYSVVGYSCVSCSPGCPRTGRSLGDDGQLLRCRSGHCGRHGDYLRRHRCRADGLQDEDSHGGPNRIRLPAVRRKGTIQYIMML